jgi:glutaminyl-peptide cyclotransferase
LKNANPVSRRGALILAAVLAVAGCRQAGSETAHVASIPDSPASAGTSATSPMARYTYEVVKTWPHDREAFTQGLVFREGNLIESTGLNARSTLREVQLETGKVLKQVTVPPAYFAEGVAVIDEEAFQLTWQNRKGFVYDVDTFQLRKEFTYEGEGWGLATDGKALILSDGTSQIRFIDPVTFSVTRAITVRLEGKPVDRLNELEYIRGEIFANVWQTDDVIRIDPATGTVRGVINFSGLLAPQDRAPETDVLNGIAYDARDDRLFVTGKRWPRVFEVRLKVKQ